MARQAQLRWQTRPWAFAILLSVGILVNQPILAQSASNLNLQVPGVFNTQMNDNLQVLLNSCSTSVEYALAHGQNASEGFASCLKIPAGTTAPVAIGVSAYMNDSTQNQSAVAEYGQTTINATGGLGWGYNGVVEDASGVTGAQFIGDEEDLFVKGTSPGTIVGYDATGNFGSVAPSAQGITGFIVNVPNQSCPGCSVSPTTLWTNGFTSATGAIAPPYRAFSLGASSSANNSPSQQISFNSVDGGGIPREADIDSNSSGDLNLSPASGRVILGSVQGSTGTVPVVTSNGSNSNFQFVVLHSVYTNATTSYTTISDGTRSTSWSLEANQDYTLTCEVPFSGSAITAGPKFQLTFPSGVNAANLDVDGGTNATAYANAVANGTSSPLAVTVLGTLGTASTKLVTHVTAGVSVGNAGGTLTLQAAASGTGTLTILAGSFCRLQ
jgi:hypothetical protein